MPEPTAQPGQNQTERVGRRKVVVGEVISNRMHKTIVVETIRKKSHRLYGRVVAQGKKFYAHDEKDPAALQAEALAP